MADFLTQAIRDIQTGVTDPLIRSIQAPITGGIQETQKAAEGTTAALTGKSLTEMGETEGGLIGAAMDFQGQLMKGGIGNIASAFGLEPKTLLIFGGVAAVAIVIILVVLKT